MTELCRIHHPSVVSRPNDRSGGLHAQNKEQSSYFYIAPEPYASEKSCAGKHIYTKMIIKKIQRMNIQNEDESVKPPVQPPAMLCRL
ncbi:unnamed protein product [Cuscuta epithymum]|uniref:Uncharacterized protein n=1 Tax=Cuscuta epithymum TaxID=186058 RepID=A0AAV0CBU1_9ASTE|nr:unnamed protein product [Cuscuta epithymum]